MARDGNPGRFDDANILFDSFNNNLLIEITILYPRGNLKSRRKEGTIFKETPFPAG
jgi:hypothetical protein